VAAAAKNDIIGANFSAARPYSFAGSTQVTPTRRTVIKTAGLALAAPALDLLAPAPVARAEERKWRHGLSLFGELRYPRGFKHFEYVDPNAPKGGVVRLNAIGSFDNFNVVIAMVKGDLAAGLNLVYETLMTRALDEVTTEYGLIAESISHPDDFSSVTYQLRPQAKWHDGAPLTPEDVIFSFEAYKKHSPQMAAYYRHVVKVEKSGPHEVTFIFDGPGNRELPQIVGQFDILPKHWWEGSDKAGKKRDVSLTTLEPPLGSAAYRLKEFIPGRSIAYERVKDYWGKDLNVSLGRFNFDELRYEYYRDPFVALEAFRADRADWRTENSAKEWATGYDFPAVRENRVIKEEFPVYDRGIMQAFVFNTRRDKFKDPRVRRAFNFAFDFEEMNKQIFFGQYTRISSYFEGTELACNWRPNPKVDGAEASPPAPAVPEGLELQILEAVRDKVPPEVFTKPYTNPVGGNPEAVRNNLREALRLLKEAGYEVRNQRLVNAQSNEPFTLEYLLENPQFERIALFYKPSLERIGVTMTVRTVDPAQYENRLRQWDFDLITSSWSESLSPGNEQREYWGSQAADMAGSRNYIGIKNPAVDALTERVIFAKNREELVAATRALDRVLLWNHYVVPQWTYGKQRTARWDRFGRPKILPKYAASGFPTVWWWDAERAAKVGTR
jgi:microcin C transport system substrate-binding protein